jgi:catalase (peroxidase I)
MLTPDLAFLEDEKYKAIVDTFASNITELENQFKHAWYKLMTRDMGPIERCLGKRVPPVQDFQRPLPPTPEQLPDYIPVRSAIQSMLDKDTTLIPELINLAYRCSFTYRQTDHAGGCNGARIRFSPEKDWPENAGTEETLKKLEPIKNDFPDISYSDLIVLAGQTALEAAGGNQMSFCGGRTDATDAESSDVLAPRHYEPAVVSIRDDMEVKGLSAKQMVALAGRPMMGGDNATVTNNFFTQLVDLDFEAALTQEEKSEGTGQNNYGTNSSSKAFVSVGTGAPLYLTAEEYALVQDPEFYKIVKEYAKDEASFKSQLASAWTYMMTAGRYSGPTSNVCTERDDPTIDVTQVMGSAEAVTKSATSATTASADQSSAAAIKFGGVAQFFVGATIMLIFSLL